MQLREFPYVPPLLHVALNEHTPKLPSVHHPRIVHCLAGFADLYHCLVNVNAPGKPDAFNGEGLGWLHLRRTEAEVSWYFPKAWRSECLKRLLACEEFGS